MSCSRPLYEQFLEHLNIKDYTVDIERKDSKTVIKLYCKESDINVKDKLNFLNNLYYKFNCQVLVLTVSLQQK